MSQDFRMLGMLDEVSQLINNEVSYQSLESSVVTITGASGMVGLNLVAALVYYNKTHAKRQIKINAISFSKPSGISLDLFSHSSVNIFFGDITDYEFMSTIPSSDFIIHSAGYAQPAKFMDNKLKTISINTTSTIDLMSKLKANGSFLFISSSEVYSGCSRPNNTESDIGNTDPSHPRACYIESKRTGETIINIARKNGVKAASARLALAYGPGVKIHDTRAMNQLINNGIEGEINLLDSGNAIRTYCYISDVVISLSNILIKNKHSVYNVGGISTTSIKDLALSIGEKLSAPVNIPDNKKFLSGAPTAVGLNLSRIEDEYGHKDYVGLDYGLTKTIDWIRLCNE